MSQAKKASVLEIRLAGPDDSETVADLIYAAFAPTQAMQSAFGGWKEDG